jgi:uncharacterized protein YcbX
MDVGVLALWRYPVKAMLGELLDAVEIGLGGCAGDRRWIVVDARTGERIANKRGPTDPRLRACRASLGEEGELRVTLPDGAMLEGAEIAAALSELLGRPVRLEAGTHHDAFPIHLITTSTLAHLRTIAPESDWDARRFRPNVVLDDGEPADGFAEDALLGGRLRAPSGLELAVELPTPRCVVPTRAREELPADPRILRTLVREHRVDLGPFGRQGCAGAYAEVARAGEVRVGQRLAVEPGETTVEAAVARLVEKLATELG